ncbi:hypothetical protein BGZ83_003742 [Gryganskiella cystojenkinii]|nr:hypothetical protein BGZ83_003742 [Gryganskiella cystojenkinii]
MSRSSQQDSTPAQDCNRRQGHEQRQQNHLPQKKRQQQQQQHQQQQQQRPRNRIGSMVLPPSPMAIPEILLQIADRLSDGSITVCLRVCRLWHQSFLPRLWNSIKIEPGCGPAGKGPDPEVLAKHASLVHKIRIETEEKARSIARSGVILPNLWTMCLHQDDNDPQMSENVVELVRRHQSSLKSLTIGCEAGEETLDAVTACPLLEELTIYNLQSSSPEAWMRRYRTLWSRLRVLFLGGDWFLTESGSDSSSLYSTSTGSLPPTSLSPSSLPITLDTTTAVGFTTNIQELEFETTVYEETVIQTILLLLLNSPELTRLTWSDLDEDDELDYEYNYEKATADLRTHVMPLARLASLIRSGQFRAQLESIELPLHRFSNRDLRVILQSMTRLTSINLTFTSFDLGSWTILKQEFPRYLSTVTTLKLRGSRDVTGSMVHDILCCMTALEVFSADYVKAANLLQDKRPWVCTRMRDLFLPLVMSNEQTNGEAGSGSSGTMLSRLSNLTRLEILGFGEVIFSASRDMEEDVWLQGNPKLVAPMTLNEGLDQLRSLRRLRIFQGSEIIWKAEEARWALKNWVSLRKVRWMTMDVEAWSILQGHVQLRSCRTINTS